MHWLGIEPRTFRSHIQRPNCWATKSPTEPTVMDVGCAEGKESVESNAGTAAHEGRLWPDQSWSRRRTKLTDTRKCTQPQNGETSPLSHDWWDTIFIICFKTLPLLGSYMKCTYTQTLTFLIELCQISTAFDNFQLKGAKVIDLCVIRSLSTLPNLCQCIIETWCSGIYVIYRILIVIAATMFMVLSS